MDNRKRSSNNGYMDSSGILKLNNGCYFDPIELLVATIYFLILFIFNTIYLLIFTDSRK